MSINLQTVRKAFKATGLRPAKGTFYTKQDEGKCVACVLGALAIYHGEDPETVGYNGEMDYTKFGITEKYAEGLIQGWDDDWNETKLIIKEYSGPNRKHFVRGCKMGQYLKSKLRPVSVVNY